MVKDSIYEKKRSKRIQSNISLLLSIVTYSRQIPNLFDIVSRKIWDLLTLREFINFTLSSTNYYFNNVQIFACDKIARIIYLSFCSSKSIYWLRQFLKPEHFTFYVPKNNRKNLTHEIQFLLSIFIVLKLKRMSLTKPRICLFSSDLVNPFIYKLHFPIISYLL